MRGSADLLNLLEGWCGLPVQRPAQRAGNPNGLSLRVAAAPQIVSRFRSNIRWRKKKTS